MVKKFSMLNRKTNIYITYNGCQMRGLDASKLKSYFLQNGCNIINNAHEADYIVFYTCSVNEITFNHSLQIIEKLNINQKAKIIVTGCLPAITPESLEKQTNHIIIPLRKIEEINKVFVDFKFKYCEVNSVGTINIERFDSEFINLEKGVFTPIEKEEKKNKIISTLKKTFGKSVKTYYLRISDGCNNDCSYCNIKKAIGKLKSRQPEEIINEYENAIGRGFNNIVFIADDPGAYGTDVSLTFTMLIDEILIRNYRNKVNWVFDELNPQWFLKYFDSFKKLVVNNKTDIIVCPVQSGSQKILQLMNRPYDIQKVMSLLKLLKALNKDIQIHTHIIIGFPGEKEADFKETIELFEKTNVFSHVLLSRFYNNNRKINELTINDNEKERRIGLIKEVLENKQITYFIA